MQFLPDKLLRKSTLDREQNPLWAVRLIPFAPFLLKPLALNYLAIARAPLTSDPSITVTDLA
jgi:hypothetical protein